MVAFDATVLIDLFNGRLEGQRRQRIDLLMSTLVERGQKIIVPAPAFAEFMTGAGAAAGMYRARMQSSRVFSVAAFDEAAAIECAMALGEAFGSKEKRAVSRTKFKFDWMIVATAKSVPGVSALYTADADVVRYGGTVALPVIHVDGLPLPEQGDWIAQGEG